MDSSEMSNTTDPHSWNIADRVVLRGLTKASHLNGQHGCIGGFQDSETGRYPIDFDMVEKRVMARAENLLLEKSLPRRQLTPPINGTDANSTSNSNADPSYRASCQNGILVEEEGRPLGLLLDSIRVIVGKVFHNDPDIHNLGDIEKLRQQGVTGLIKINSLMRTAWAQWRLVYDLLRKFFDELPGMNQHQIMPPEFSRAAQALDHITATKGWHTRIQGNFWIVSCDYAQEDGGTLVISDDNRHAVYKVFGLRNSLFHMIQPQQPILMRLTLIAWYGRLVYDGTAFPAHSLPGPPEMADAVLSSLLRKRVQVSQQEGRVIDKLSQLEYEPVLESNNVPTSVPVAGTTKDLALDSAAKSPPTNKEMEYLQKVEQLPVSSDTWCLRRRGYSEQDNPTHEGVIINVTANGGFPLGTFHCDALAPNPVDILHALFKSRPKRLPTTLLIDDLSCCQRVQYLLQEHTTACDMQVQYYAPPSAEEQASASTGR